MRSRCSYHITIMFLLLSCGKSFLSPDLKALQLETDYFKTTDQVLSSLVGCYDPLSWEGAINHANFLVFVAGSDECYSGGGSSSDMPYLQVMNNYSIDPATGSQADFWQQYFTGVARANAFLNRIAANNIAELSDSLQKRYTAEVKVLRSYFYFNLVRLFKNIPLYLKPLQPHEIYTQTQAAPELVYRQIERDLKDAIEERYLPDRVNTVSEGGRMTKGIAKALLGKVYLYQSKWQDAALVLKEVNGVPGAENPYGYRLLSDFAAIFRPDNKFHTESILEISHNAGTFGSFGNPRNIEGLIASVMVGPRSYSGELFVFGWGGCPVIPAFAEQMWSDPRYGATVADIDSLVELKKATYTPGYLNTGKFVRKFAPLKSFRPPSGGNPAANYPQNYIEIRLADAYLMEAEALVKGAGDPGRAGMLLNAVRSRVGLPPIAPSLENIYRERMFELATEGHRWFDLVRWNRAHTTLAFKGFQQGKHEIFPIPLNELNNTRLVQNPNY
ncbi:MAG: RagB/SusD family nutrient uptake outer membrane protein [Niabella sp.]